MVQTSTPDHHINIWFQLKMGQYSHLQAIMITISPCRQILYLTEILPEGKYLSVLMYNFPIAASLVLRLATLAFPVIALVLNISIKNKKYVIQ